RRLVQHEVRMRLAVLVVAKLGEQTVPKAGPLDRLEELLRNDHVGIDIDHRQMSGDTRQCGEFLHEPAASSSSPAKSPGHPRDLRNYRQYRGMDGRANTSLTQDSGKGARV